jgi:hypothetical protein
VKQNSGLILGVGHRPRRLRLDLQSLEVRVLALIWKEYFKLPTTNEGMRLSL